MEFTIKTGSPAKLKTGLLVLGAFADGRLPALSAAADGAAEGRLATLIKRGDLDEKAGASVLVHDLPGVHAERVLLVSLGKHDEFGDKAFRDALAAAAKAISGGPAKDAVVALADIELPGRDAAWRLQQATRMLADGAYRFDVLKSDKKAKKERGAKKLSLLVSCELGAELDTAAMQGHAIAAGMALAKDLGNLPGNICTPTHLAETAEALGKQYKFDVEVLEREDMEKLGMGSFLSVARGSHQPPKFIVMHYKGGKAKAKPVVLVGKGITFDTGGISLKPAAEMDEMKYDMCGAASVLGTFKAVAQMGLPINLVGLWDASTWNVDRSWYPSALKGAYGEGVWAMDTDPRSCLWVGGDLVRGAYSGNAATDYLGGFARFCPADATAPSKPGSFAVASTGTSRKLTWSAASDPGGGPITYDVVRNGRVVAQTSAATLTFTDPDAPAGTSYTVRAVDARGNRSASPAPKTVS